jgi:serine/threonine protein kinase
MARRMPSRPPVLPGFSFIRVLGSGGFADVFLYEQNMPRRQVAVKVMLAEVVNDGLRTMFQSEANIMAQLSAHPSVLTVYQASVAADGRPYLVTELCAPKLSERYQKQPLAIGEALRVGVTIGSALEAAHRLGVLHRDVKPSNILTTVYGQPVLSDFGIAATVQQVVTTGAVGLSVPWSAPEVLRVESNGSVAADLWSLAATVYALLAGHAPFEVAGRPNTAVELQARAKKGVIAGIPRDDVPESLMSILRRALARQPSARPPTALEFARELKSVEIQLGLASTPLEVTVDDWARVSSADPYDETQLRPADSPVGGSVPPGGRTRIRRSRYLVGAILACVAVVAALGVVVGLVLTRASVAQAVPSVAEIHSRIDGNTIEFRWVDPGIIEGDMYQIATDSGAPSLQRAPQFRVDLGSRASVCVTVTVNRKGVGGTPSAKKCVDLPAGGGRR